MFLFVVIILLVIVIAILSLGLYQKNTNALYLKHDEAEDLCVVVTGGTAGMGLQLACALAARGARVVLAGLAREGPGALRAVRAACPRARVRFEPLDLASLRATRDFARRLRASEPCLHVLVNNAGVGGPGARTADRLLHVMQVNYYGTFLLTLLLLPLLRAGARPARPSRILNVASASYIFGREYMEDTLLCVIPSISYFISKLYIVIFTRELAKRLKHANVVVNNVDPGVVGTNIFRTATKLLSPFITIVCRVLFKTPWEGMQTALYAALDEDAGRVTGEHFKNCRLVKTSKIACDEKQAARLWSKSARLVELTDEELTQALN